MSEPEMSSHMLEFIVRAINAKSAAITAGDVGGRFDCPKCRATVSFILVGEKNHLRARCATHLCLGIIE